MFVQLDEPANTSVTLQYTPGKRTMSTMWHIVCASGTSARAGRHRRFLAFLLVRIPLRSLEFSLYNVADEAAMTGPTVMAGVWTAVMHAAEAQQQLRVHSRDRHVPLDRLGALVE